ncbi:MAG: hypothetical protein O3C57_08735, partial [Verrucomicrobia bacterium]|nr:hypothetical protein [Verrucomicrobiota bacterium]
MRKPRFATSTTGRMQVLVLVSLISAITHLSAQELSYDNRRDVAIPDHSTLRIGSFYSSIRLTESAGYRYTTSSGAGSDFLINNRRGVTRRDGSDFPIISTLDFRNYLMVTRHMDLDVSFRISYRYFPLRTQEDDFNVSLPGEGLGANISTQFQVTDYLIGSVYERFQWVTDYVDDRGVSDNTGGRRYERIQNDVGVDFDWLMAEDK